MRRLLKFLVVELLVVLVRIQLDGWQDGHLLNTRVFASLTAGDSSSGRRRTAMACMESPQLTCHLLAANQHMQLLMFVSSNRCFEIILLTVERSLLLRGCFLGHGDSACAARSSARLMLPVSVTSVLLKQSASCQLATLALVGPNACQVARAAVKELAFLLLFLLFGRRRLSAALAGDCTLRGRTMHSSFAQLLLLGARSLPNSASGLSPRRWSAPLLLAARHLATTCLIREIIFGQATEVQLALEQFGAAHLLLTR